MMPTETELTHFLELYKTQHFTRAAIKLGIAQPSLTQSILKLEEKVGTSLFHRTRQGCTPTPSAEILFEKAVAMADLWQSLQIKMLHHGKSLAGTFRIGCHESVGTYTLPPFLKSLQQKAPNIEIRLEHDWSRKINEKIINYEIDLGFVINPFKHPDLVLTKIGVDRIGFWKAKGTQPLPLIFCDASVAQVQGILGKKFAAKYSHYKIVDDQFGISSHLDLDRNGDRNFA